MNKLLSRKIIFFLYIPTFLILFWIVSSLLFNNTISFTVLVYPHENKLILPDDKRMFKGDKISGEFIASDNHLGLVIIKLNDYVRYGAIGEDVLLFKIKEKDSKDWYFASTYRAGIMDRRLDFPIGIPLADNSVGKKYYFELESLYGDKDNAIDTKKIVSTFHTGYKYSKNEIFGGKKALAIFLFNKVVTSFSNIDFLIGSTLYLVPLLSYIFIIAIRKYSKVKSYTFIFILLIIMLDILLTKDFYLGLSLIVAVGWLFSVLKLKFQSRVSFLIFSIMIFVWMLLMLINIPNYNVKLNFWSFFFLLSGIIHIIAEEKQKGKIKS